MLKNKKVCATAATHTEKHITPLAPHKFCNHTREYKNGDVFLPKQKHSTRIITLLTCVATIIITRK